MATCKPGSLVGSITGRVGGLEFGSGRSGIVVRTAKRSRRVDSPDAAFVRCFTNWFWSVWYAASDNTRAAWRWFASTQKVLNRNSQWVSLKPERAAFLYHFEVMDWLNRQIDFGSAYLLPPPAKLDLIPQPSAPSLAFTDAAYILHAEHDMVFDPKAIVYAARGRGQAWTSIKSWRFVCSFTQSSGDSDLISYFAALSPPWELLVGERVFVRFYWQSGSGPSFPNFRTYLSTVVTSS